ncbi:bifunctional 3-(3-hydroxy-phenyl)propionate/3-hydroxycinnamic acid hydroxylase [Actinokineospora auranticolor]|uniref:3-(3-hydroxy-phenyl)propionate hydroxylase n=1 Tax=Actinokineospora auranticolor TaxID=155976 RepID=A0A2S6H0E8_9PSEU|nr:bifunctional 3-(3-hydroxy-phenyl)propionate/3-hydroxycinnamic acid hydroxylase [Actinokineospora auranticolor]PPK70887.1 3-(3-hydroxy-phenyl)propionate hydroxylase [Actinokineospora auranticolor]
MTDPVVVVGAGPVGLTAAALLIRRGVPTVVLERHPAPYPLPRAVHLDGEALRVLQDAGVASRFHAVSRPMPGLRLVDRRHRVLAEFRRDARTGPNGHPDASMFNQPDLERLLRGEVGAAVRWGVTVTGLRGDTLLTDARPVPARAILACDGADSTVRRLLDIPTRALGEPHDWLVVDAESPRPLTTWDGVHQVCDHRHPATFMRVTGDHYRWEFRYPLSHNDLRGLLTPWLVHLGAIPFEAMTILRAATYTYHAQVATRWHTGRTFLLGDAAHQLPPFTGQGLGAGLRDAHNLVWKLDLALRTGNDEILRTYQPERLPHAVRTIRAAQVIGWALTAGPARRTAIRAAVAIPGVSAAASRYSSPKLGRSALIARHRLAGTLFPQRRTPDGWTDDLLTPPAVVDPAPRRPRYTAVRPDWAIMDATKSTKDLARLAELVASLTPPEYPPRPE